MSLVIVDLPLIVAGVVALIAATTDLWRFRVYNALTLPALALGLAAAGLAAGWPGLRLALLGAGLGFGVLLVLHALGGVGAGDVKLLAALGAWLGPEWLVRVFAASALLTGAYALALVFWERGVLGVGAELVLTQHALLHPSTLRRAEGSDLASEVARPDRRRRLVPFAAMTGIGFVAVVLGSSDRPMLATPLHPSSVRDAIAAISDDAKTPAPSHLTLDQSPSDREADR